MDLVLYIWLQANEFYFLYNYTTKLNSKKQFLKTKNRKNKLMYISHWWLNHTWELFQETLKQKHDCTVLVGHILETKINLKLLNIHPVGANIEITVMRL